MQSISVHIRDHVDQGQAIGAVGKSGGVDQSQLHFETRYSPAPKVKHNPVDPLTLLP
jgi:murein DD-endopeptidase MepM/ murein hydrolase activator NlpD